MNDLNATGDAESLPWKAGELSRARDEFLSLLAPLRPALHRYCSHMLGSAIDGEDAVQDVLATAFLKIPLYRQPGSLRGWLFTIAHHRCVDLRRSDQRRDRMEETMSIEADPAEEAPVDMTELEQGLRRLVHHLSPMERSCLIFKDVLGHPLDEIAPIVQSTTGGVKHALHRARTKLREARGDREDVVPSEEEVALLRRYVSLFNQRDWDGLEALLKSDARLEVVDRFVTMGSDAIAVGYYGRLKDMPNLRLRMVRLDGELAVVYRDESGEASLDVSAARLTVQDGQVTHIMDYLHVHYLLNAAMLEEMSED